MIFVKLEIDNLYTFEKFNINFTYDRKLPSNPLENEYLKKFPNFKYRRVNILMGANSSGKTSLGKIMMNIQNLISKKTFEYLPISQINNKKKDAKISVDFVNEDKLYRYMVIFDREGIKKEEIIDYKLKKSDSYNIAKENLLNEKPITKIYNEDDTKEISEILKDKKINFGWFYSFALISEKNNNHVVEHDINIMEKILKGFDCTIEKIDKLTGKDSFNIIFKNKDNIAMQDGKIVNLERISTGTYESIRIASILSQMKNNERNYFIDENIVHSHTEMEKAILNTMVNLLEGDSQLFFTTHNMDILELNLPIHSYQILRNENGNSDVVDTCDKYNKNDRNLRNYIENDEFKTIPSSDFLLEIEWKKYI